MSLPTLTVEVAFTTDPDSSTPAYQDVSSYAVSGSIRRGRQYELDQIQPSTLTLTLNNGDRRFDPTYSFSPFYPYVLPMRKIRVSATWSGTTYRLFTGYVERWPIEWDQPAWGTVTLTAVDGFGVLGNALIADEFPQEFTGSRINRVLTAAAWPASTPQPGGYWTLGTSALDTTTILSYGIPATNLAAGQSQVQDVTFAVTDNVNALQHIQDVVDAERGVFFINGAGDAVFFDRLDRYNTSSVVTFTDNAGTLDATHLPYKDRQLQPDCDVTRIVNDVTVTRDGGTAQNAVDNASRQTYWRRSLQLTPPLVSDTEALDQANYELVLHRATGGPRQMTRFDRIGLNSQANDNSWPHALGREISDRVTVVRTPGTTPAGTSETITKDCFIEAIEHTWSPGVWDTAFQLSPADPYDVFFELGASTLDAAATAVLGY